MNDRDDLNSDRNRAIVECVAAGQPLRRAAATFGVSLSHVWRIADRAGVHSHCTRIPSWPAERIETFRQLRAEGLSLTEIARRLGVSSKGTMGRYAKLHGITTPQPAMTREDYAARNRTIIERVGSGVSHAQAATEFGVSKGRISQIVRRARREVRPQTAAMAT